MLYHTEQLRRWRTLCKVLLSAGSSVRLRQARQ